MDRARQTEIGEGGMATVYLAEDLRHERKVALKVLKPELAALGNCGSAELDVALARARSCSGLVGLGTTRAG